MGKIKVRKIPVIDTSRCNRCYNCVSVCPQKAIKKPVDVTCAKCVKYCITMDLECSLENIIISDDLCNRCGLCIASCANGAINPD